MSIKNYGLGPRGGFFARFLSRCCRDQSERSEKIRPKFKSRKPGSEKLKNEGPLEAQARDPCQLELCSSTRDLGTPAPFAMFVFIIGMIFRP